MVLDIILEFKKTVAQFNFWIIIKNKLRCNEKKFKLNTINGFFIKILEFFEWEFSLKIIK